MFDYGNVERVLWDAATAQGGSMVYMPGTKALKYGQIILFWPLSEDGTIGHEQPVIEYRVRLTNGNQVITPDLASFANSGITIAIGDFTTRGYKSERFATVTNTGTLGILDISVIMKAYPNQTFVGITDRVAALEEALNGSGGDSFTPGAAVPDPASGGNTTALTAPAAGSDAAAIVTWLGNMVTQFNSQRTTVGNARNALLALLKSLRDAGIINK